VRDAYGDPTAFHLLARGVSAIAGTATVAIVYRVGALLFDRTTGLVAAMFLAVAALHVRDSHFGMTDVAATCLLTLSFFFTARASRTGARRDLLLSALWAGLAASTKYNAGLVALPGLWVVLTTPPVGTKHWRHRLRLATTYAGVAAGAFLVGTPYAVLDFPSFSNALVQITAHLRAGHTGREGFAWPVHLATSLPYGLGMPMFVAGVVGLGLYWTKDRRQGLLFAIFPVLYFVLISSGRTAFARYVLPVIPFLCIAAAYTTSVVAKWIATRAGSAAHEATLTWAFAVLVAIPSALSSVQSDRLLMRTDNRLLVAAWVRERFGKGARLYQSGLIYAKVQMRTADPLAAEHYTDVEFDDQTGTFVNADRSPASAPDVVLVPECVHIYCQAPNKLRQALARDYRIERTFIASDPRHPGVYDLEDAFFLPLSGWFAVSRPGPNFSAYVPVMASP